MKSRDFLTEVRALSVVDLNARAHQIAEELMKLRFRKASGQAEHGMRIRVLRRNLARVNTLITSHGTDTAPKATAPKAAASKAKSSKKETAKASA